MFKYMDIYRQKYFKLFLNYIFIYVIYKFKRNFVTCAYVYLQTCKYVNIFVHINVFIRKKCSNVCLCI